MNAACPGCGGDLDERAFGWRRPVLWEGRVDYGHTGCLADLLRSRGWRIPVEEPELSTAGALWDPESQC